MVNAARGLLWLAVPRYAVLTRKLEGMTLYREPLSILGT